ncbi:MAG: hypothetical protein V8S34_08630 [Lawsonibacter sp.]
MMRTESNRDLIAEIEGGIKKEVSVGCAVERSVCSICGADRRNGDCGHKKGERYDGALCFTRLMGASDAYEFSFVAVPAQPAAGIVKGMEGRFHTLKALAEGHPECAGELEELEREACLAGGAGSGPGERRCVWAFWPGWGWRKRPWSDWLRPCRRRNWSRWRTAGDRRRRSAIPVSPAAI